MLLTSEDVDCRRPCRREFRSTLQVREVIGFYPRPDIDTAGTQVVSQAGTVLLTETVRTVGLDRALSMALQRSRPQQAVHDPAKVLIDLALDW
jgi:hypothetical protein